MRSTIIFYTHNFLSRKLLESTVLAAIKHAFVNNCFLILISHFPILSEYKDVSDLSGGSKDVNLPDDLSKFCIRDLKINVSKDLAINYVTGKLPYKCQSILNQLLFALKQCETENCILYEHDCFYPANYYSIVEKNLEKYEMTYCKENYWMVNRDGFYKCEPHIYLSSYAAKTSTFLNVFQNKKRIYGEGEIRVFEPIIPYDRIIKDINWDRKIKKLIRPKTSKDIGDPIIKNLSSFKDEIITDNSVCIDSELCGCVLEFQHGLNTSGSLATMRNVYDNGNLEPEYREKNLTHPYWGELRKFTDMLEVIEKTDLTSKMGAIGVHHCGI